MCKKQCSVCYCLTLRTKYCYMLTYVDLHFVRVFTVKFGRAFCKIHGVCEQQYSFFANNISCQNMTKPFTSNAKLIANFLSLSSRLFFSSNFYNCIAIVNYIFFLYLSQIMYHKTAKYSISDVFNFRTNRFKPIKSLKALSIATLAWDRDLLNFICELFKWRLLW